jgi:predicted acyl esterase
VQDCWAGSFVVARDRTLVHPPFDAIIISSGALRTRRTRHKRTTYIPRVVRSELFVLTMCHAYMAGTWIVEFNILEQWFPNFFGPQITYFVIFLADHQHIKNCFKFFKEMRMKFKQQLHPRNFYMKIPCLLVPLKMEANRLKYFLGPRSLETCSLKVCLLSKERFRLQL